MENKTEFLINRNININTDGDGLFSGALLETFGGCRTTGFNDNNIIWKKDGEDWNCTFIDTDIMLDGYVSVGQHVLAMNTEHFHKLKGNRLHLNPNFDFEDRIRCFEHDYFYKYPMGTFHYLIWCLECSGVKVEFPNLYEPYYYTDRFGIRRVITIGEIITRPDNLLYSAFVYTENMLDWLNKFSEGSETMSKIKDFVVDALKQKGRVIEGKSIEKYVKDSQDYFFKEIGADDGDGGFNSLNVADGSGELTQRFLGFNNKIREILGWKECDWSGNFGYCQGEIKAFKILSPSQGLELIEDFKPFGYAITNGMNTSKWNNLKMTIFK